LERFFSTLLGRLGYVGTLIDLARPWNGIMVGLLPILSLLMGGGSFSLQALLLFLAFFFGWASGATLNDIFDRDVDKINMPFRPILKRKLKISNVYRYTIILHLLAVFFAIYLDIKILLFVILFFIFSSFYNSPPLHLNRKGILGHIDLVFTVVAIPTYAGFVFALQKFTLPFDYWLFIFGLTLFFLFIFMLKDFKDLVGDRKKGKITPVVQLGPKKIRTIIMVGSILSLILLMFLYYKIIDFQFWHLVPWLFSFIALPLAESIVIKKPESGWGWSRVVVLILILSLILINLLS